MWLLGSLLVQCPMSSSSAKGKGRLTRLEAAAYTVKSAVYNNNENGATFVELVFDLTPVTTSILHVSIVKSSVLFVNI